MWFTVTSDVKIFFVDFFSPKLSTILNSHVFLTLGSREKNMGILIPFLKIELTIMGINVRR